MRSLLGVFIILTIGCQSNEQKIYTTAPDWANSSHTVQNGMVTAVGSGSTFGLAWMNAWNNVLPEEDEYFLGKIPFNGSEYSIQIEKSDTNTYGRYNDDFSWDEITTISFVVDSISFYQETFITSYFVSSPFGANAELFQNLYRLGEATSEEVKPDTSIAINDPVVKYENVDRDVTMAILSDSKSNIQVTSVIETNGLSYIHHIQLKIPDNDLQIGNNGIEIPLTAEERLYSRFNNEAFKELQRQLERLGLSNESEREDDSEN